MSRREQIRMSPEEVSSFLDEERVVICASHGPRGWPHLMPLWYLVRNGDIWTWSYAKSQKVRNLERDARATLQVEAGDRYDQLRGVMIEAETVIHRDAERTVRFGLELFERYGGEAARSAAEEMVRSQAPKRVLLQFRARRTASFDHRKLGGVY
jgi:nitroimidazol reductase NimA-like FMN-containing flavoprotein (pyridoxamine 5'-phosphate oxidase superfamily)